MKYWTLYWKDIEKMTKEELCEHLVETYRIIENQSNELHKQEMKIFALQFPPTKNIIQRFLWL